MRPAAIIFDMDEVLCGYDLGKRLRALSRFTGRTPRDIRAAVWDSGFEDEADSGGFPEPEQYLAEFGRRIGHAITRAQWVEARRLSMSPWPEMLALARRLGEQARLALYTNNGPLAKAELGQLFPDVAALFSERYFSFELGVKKPDPASYLKVTGLMGIDPSLCWFIDDKRSNVEGARLAGLQGHHFRNREQLIADARSLGFAA
jgi:HAD superfamily hydrolase (TIGR01509 family)